MKKIDSNTTVAELINLASVSPEMLKLSIGALGLMASATHKKRSDGLSSEMTLTDFYQKWYKPKVSLRNKRKDNTISSRETSLRYWEKITGNPPLREISDDTAQTYADGLYLIPKRGGGTLNTNTVSKHCEAICSVLCYAGPKCNGFRRAQGLINEVPEFPEFEEIIDIDGRTPTMDEFNKLLRACKVASRPIAADITPAEWFRNVYLFIYSTGIRCGDLLQARWNWLKKKQDIICLIIPPDNEKTHRERIVPLNDMAKSVLQKMPRRGESELIFPFNKDSKKATESAIQLQRNKIAKSAKLEKVLVTFHAIRRLTASMLDPAAAANVLGNNPITCRQHYQTVAVAKRAVDALPVPDLK